MSPNMNRCWLNVNYTIETLCFIKLESKYKGFLGKKNAIANVVYKLSTILSHHQVISSYDINWYINYRE